jgi:glycosyltransferase involved in cell wall biosynthesis
MIKRKISIVSGTFNEEENIDELHSRISEAIFPWAKKYDFEIIVIDNASTDNTVKKLREIGPKDNRLKIIVNTRNFGHIRSPYWGILQANGDAVIYLASDLQDPPELINEFIQEWEKGWKIVFAVKPTSQASTFFHLLRKIYYRLLNSISEIELINDATGFGIYDKRVIDDLREIRDPYPYLRGLICELGYPIKTLPFNQPPRRRGFSKNNIYTLYDIAMLGLVSHSILPLRIAGILGFMISGMSALAAMIYLMLMLVRWNDFHAGIAPLVIGACFFLGLLFGFIGFLGEYIGSIHNYIKKRPIVVEKERFDFEKLN